MQKDKDKHITKKWWQNFRHGYIEQAFNRAVVKEKLGHGEANLPYLRRADWKRLTSGKTVTKYERKLGNSMEAEQGETPARPRNLKDILTEEAPVAGPSGA